jgi:hypothetical protein
VGTPVSQLVQADVQLVDLKLQNWYANDFARRHELLKDSIYTLGRLSVATDQF